MFAAAAGERSAYPRALTAALIVLAALRTWGALADVPAAFVDFGHTETTLVVAQWITTARLIVAPMIAGTALYLAVTFRLPTAIIVLAVLILVGWLSELPDLPIHGFDLSPTFGGVTTIAEFVLYPICALVAIVLAARGRLIMLAAGLVSLPTIALGILLVGFAVLVAIHGF